MVIAAVRYNRHAAEHTHSLHLEPLDLDPLDLEPLDSEPLDLEPLDLEPLRALFLKPLRDSSACDRWWRKAPRWSWSFRLGLATALPVPHRLARPNPLT